MPNHRKTWCLITTHKAPPPVVAGVVIFSNLLGIRREHGRNTYTFASRLVAVAGPDHRVKQSAVDAALELVTYGCTLPHLSWL